MMPSVCISWSERLLSLVALVTPLHFPPLWTNTMARNTYKVVPTLLNAYTNTPTPIPTPTPPSPLTWYTCGPTVYADSHLGHGWTYMHVDLVQRALSSLYGIETYHVRNVTDVDDKIRAAAGAGGVSIADVAETHLQSFEADMAALNIAPPSSSPRVTSSLPAIVSFVQSLLDKGAAYTGPDGSVLFDTHAFGPQYPNGFFASQVVGQESPSLGLDGTSSADFALWKASPDDPDAFDAPFGRGFPGWHVECSAMIAETLGSHVDVHAGGIDLKFPHHTNEIAQSLAAEGYPHDAPSSWASLFCHISHIHIDGAKMSKSLKNFISIRDALAAGISGNVFRLFCATHPRHAPCHIDPDLDLAFRESKAIESQILASLSSVLYAPDAPDSPHTNETSWNDSTIRQAWAHSVADNMDISRVFHDVRDRTSSSTLDVATASQILAGLDSLGFTYTDTLFNHPSLDAPARASINAHVQARFKLRSTLATKDEAALEAAAKTPQIQDLASEFGSSPPRTFSQGWALADAVRDHLHASYPIKVVDSTSHPLWHLDSKSL